VEGEFSNVCLPDLPTLTKHPAQENRLVESCGGYPLLYAMHATI
jgi:hypothetical protein